MVTEERTEARLLAAARTFAATFRRRLTAELAAGAVTLPTTAGYRNSSSIVSARTERCRMAPRHRPDQADGPAGAVARSG